MKPDDAASMLTIYEGKFTRLKDDRDNLIKAKEALELADPGGYLSLFLVFHFPLGYCSCLFLSPYHKYLLYFFHLTTPPNRNPLFPIFI